MRGEKLTDPKNKYAKDEIVNLVAIPDKGYLFNEWQGENINEAGIYSNSIDLVMNADKSISAKFIKDNSDSDGDGLSNYEELVNYYSDPYDSNSPPNQRYRNMQYVHYEFVDDEVVIMNCLPDAEGEIIIPDTIGGLPVKVIGSYAFANCWRLTSVTIPKHVTKIEYSAFENCTGIVNYIFAPTIAPELGENVFRNINVSPEVLVRMENEGYGNSYGGIEVRQAPSFFDADGDGYTDDLEIQVGSDPYLATSIPKPSPKVEGFTLSISERVNKGTLLGTLNPTHPEGDDVVLSLIDNPDHDGDGNLAFSLEEKIIFVNDGGDFDYESEQSLKVEIKASSKNSVPTFAQVRVDLLDDRDEDFDGDGLSERDEEDKYTTSDQAMDTDGDGYDDGYELGIGRFSIVLGNANYENSANGAIERGGYLATFATEDEWNNAMNSLGENRFKGYSGIWIGAVKLDEGSWGWVSGEDMTFDRWAKGHKKEKDAVKLTGANAKTIDPGYWVTRPSNTDANGYMLEIGYPTDPAKADTDGDGVNDKEEVDSGSNPLVVDQFFIGDKDRDGWQDETEILFGSSPSDLGSVPAFELKMNLIEGGQLQVLFPGEKDVGYTIQYSSDMRDWISLEKLIIGQGNTVRESFEMSGDVGFIRILENKKIK